MARGHKTGGRQKGTPNKRKAECDAKFAEAIATRDWAKTVGTLVAWYKLFQSRMEGPCTTLAHVRVTHHPNAGLRGHTDTQRSNLI
jgi:hypothetical protein